MVTHLQEAEHENRKWFLFSCTPWHKMPGGGDDQSHVLCIVFWIIRVQMTQSSYAAFEGFVFFLSSLKVTIVERFFA